MQSQLFYPRHLFALINEQRLFAVEFDRLDHSNISPGGSYSFYPLPVSVPSMNYTVLLVSTCILSLKERDDSLIFQEATKDALSELYDEYFGSHGRAKFQNMTLHLQRWDMSLPSSTETTASNNSRSSRSTSLNRNLLGGIKHRRLLQVENNLKPYLPNL